MKQYDIAAYIWPSYTPDDPRTHMFWPEGMGEWQSVKNAVKKTPTHSWPRRPLWGYVNEANADVMEMEIEVAAKYGVNVFIYDWYWYDKRPFLENCLNDGYLKARNNDKVKFYLMWANHNVDNLWDIRLSHEDNLIWYGCQDRTEFEKIVHRTIEKYFSHPSYYKINGEPVYMIFDTANFIRGLGGVDAARDALDYFRQETVKAGFPGLHLQMNICNEGCVNLAEFGSAYQGSSREAAALLGYDSTTHYQFCQFTNVGRDYCEVLADVKREWERIDRDYAMPYFPSVSVGWDNNPRFRGYQNYEIQNDTPENIEKGFRMAKEYADAHPNQPPLIVVNSWNEWTETSYLQPDDRYGYGYLEALRRVFRES